MEIKDLEQICAGDLDIRITGFNDAELDQTINLGDTVPADPKVNHIPFISEDEIASVLGDIWQIGPHRIICGNSLEESTFNQLMDGAMADTILQDPPYNVKINAMHFPKASAILTACTSAPAVGIFSHTHKKHCWRVV